MVIAYTYQGGDAELAPIFGSCIFMAIVGLFAIAITVVMTWAFCRIFAKAGYHWAMGLLILVPFGNLIVPLILAFGEWPIYRQFSKPKVPIEPATENWRGR